LGLLEAYIIFSVSTAVVGVIQIYRLVHNKLKNTHSSNIVTKAPFKAYFIFFLLGLITAPALVMVLIVPSLHTTFINSMYESITE